MQNTAVAVGNKHGEKVAYEYKSKKTIVIDFEKSNLKKYTLIRLQLAVYHQDLCGCRRRQLSFCACRQCNGNKRTSWPPGYSNE